MRKPRSTNGSKKPWAEDVERLLAEAFGDEVPEGAPKPVTPGKTEPYLFDDFVFARARSLGPGKR